MAFVVLRFMQGWTVSGIETVTSRLEGKTERRMISWEEDGRVDGSEEGGKVIGLLQGPIYQWIKRKGGTC
jgi:hypothetical protein